MIGGLFGLLFFDFRGDIRYQPATTDKGMCCSVKAPSIYYGLLSTYRSNSTRCFGRLANSFSLAATLL